MPERPRPLNTDASIQERIKQIEIVLFGDPDNPPEPEYIDATAQLVGETALAAQQPMGVVDQLDQLRNENAALRQAVINLRMGNG